MNRLRRVFLRHGIAGCVILGARFAAHYLSTALYRHERHVWYSATTSDVKAIRPLPKGLNLLRAGREHLDLLSQSNLYGWSAAETFLAEGGDLWIVREGERPVFCCWIFRERIPTVAVRGGWKGLPSNTVCLEEAVTDPGYRGRGIAPAAWSLIAQTLNEEGVRKIVTKVEEANKSMRRALLKTGLHQVAMVDYLKMGGLSRVRVVPVGEILDQDREVLTEVQKLAA